MNVIERESFVGRSTALCFLGSGRRGTGGNVTCILIGLVYPFLSSSAYQGAMNPTPPECPEN
jgi:hypothetical protein